MSNLDARKYKALVNADYRVSIPPKARKEMGIGPGDHVVFIGIGPDGAMILRRALPEEIDKH